MELTGIPLYPAFSAPRPSGFRCVLRGGLTPFYQTCTNLCVWESVLYRGDRPQENSIRGIMIEAYDILGGLGPDAGKDIFVMGELTIGIQHCLITLHPRT